MADAKLLLLGESNGGKTSIIKYRLFHKFDDTTVPTAPVNYFKQISSLIIPGREQVDISMNIWDTAGQEKFRSLTSNFFRMTRVALLVGDVTSMSSMESAFSYWLKELRANTPDAVVFFAANKQDLVDTGSAVAAMTKEQIEELCKTNDIVQWEYVSAKTGANVDRLFNSICIATAADMGLISKDEKCVSLRYKIDVEDGVDDEINVPTVVLLNLNRIRSSRAPVGSEIYENPVVIGGGGGHGKEEREREKGKGEKPKETKPVRHGELPDPEYVDINKEVKKGKKKDDCC